MNGKKKVLDRKVLAGRPEGSHEYAYVNIDDLKVPRWSGGQRVLNEAHVARILSSWEEQRLTVVVVWRTDDGTLFILDGQHRVEALRRLGRSVVFADIRTGLDEPMATYLFWRLNDDQTRVGEFDKFLARIGSEDPNACEIQRVVLARGYHLDRHGKSIHSIAAVRALDAVHSRGGGRLLGDVLAITSQAWRVDKKGLSASMLTGLGTFLDTWMDGPGYDVALRGGPVDVGRLLDVLARVSASEVEQQQRAYAAEHGHQGRSESRVAIVLRDLYNSRRRTGRLKGAPKGRSGRRGGGWVKNEWGRKRP